MLPPSEKWKVGLFLPCPQQGVRLLLVQVGVPVQVLGALTGSSSKLHHCNSNNKTSPSWSSTPLPPQIWRETAAPILSQEVVLLGAQVVVVVVVIPVRQALVEEDSHRNRRTITKGRPPLVVVVATKEEMEVMMKMARLVVPPRPRRIRRKRKKKRRRRRRRSRRTCVWPCHLLCRRRF
jgi:hypothetical protein